MTQYRLILNSEYILIIRDGVVSTIPNDPANRDWQEYQEWLALGNEPEAAE
jgi:hypothetical protein